MKREEEEADARRRYFTIFPQFGQNGKIMENIMVVFLKTNPFCLFLNISLIFLNSMNFVDDSDYKARQSTRRRAISS